MDHTKISENDQRILAARRSLTERVAALEDRVTDTVEQAKGTVDHATTSLRGTVTDATQSVRGLFTGPNGGGFDLRKQFSNHPWQGMLLAVGAGVAGRMLTRMTSSSVRTAVDSGTTSVNPISEIITSVRRELVDLGEKAINVASKKLRENIETLVSLPAGELQSPEPANNGYFHRNGGK